MIPKVQEVLMDMHSVKVEQFSYRTATVGEHFLQLPRELLNGLEEALAKKAGKSVDNHTVYSLKWKGLHEETTYIKFTDGVAIFGRSIEKRSH